MNSLQKLLKRLTSAAEARSIERERAKKDREELLAVERARLKKQTALLRLSSELAAAVDEEQIYWRVVTGLHD